jgi:hypothetical protein
VSKCTSYNALISDKKDENAHPLASMWVISAFDSKIKGEFNFELDGRWSAWGKDAFFKTGDGTNLHFVCLSRLHATPDTLPLRLLGRGATLRDALAEATAHGPMDPKLEQLVKFWGLRGKKTPSQWSQEMTAHVYKIIADIRQEIRDEGIQEGFQAGRQEGRAEPLISALEMELEQNLDPQERAHATKAVEALDDAQVVALLRALLRDADTSAVLRALGLRQPTP